MRVTRPRRPPVREPISCSDCPARFVPTGNAAKRCPACRAKRKAPAPRDESKKLGGVDPTTCDREYSAEELAFLKAVMRYRKEAKRPFPTASEYLQIAIALGWRKTEPAGPLPGCKGEG